MDLLHELLVKWHHGDSGRRDACETQEFMPGNPFRFRAHGIAKPYVKIESGKQSIIKVNFYGKSRSSQWSRSQVRR